MKQLSYGDGKMLADKTITQKMIRYRLELNLIYAENMHLMALINPVSVKVT